MKNPHSFESFLQILIERKVAFLATFFCVVVISYAVLYIIDFIPEPIEMEQEEKEQIQKTTVEKAVVDTKPEEPIVEVVKVPVDPLPVSIYFDKLGRGVDVLNPPSSDIAVLDEALLDGAVRYPESADFNTTGNMFILAHSSYLPNVFNKNFQAFNDIQKLTWGDTIRVRSADTEYVYRVQKVYQDKASNIVIPQTQGEAKLTLSTCDVLSAKEDRYVVEADFVGSQKLR